MPRRGWRGLGVDEECVLRWAEGLNPSTARNYVYYLMRYLEWCRGRGYWGSAGEMLDEYGGLGERERFRHLDVLSEYLRQKGTGVRDRRVAWHAVRSFYEFHRLPLPRLSRSELSRLFAPSGADRRRSLEASTLRLEEVRMLVMGAPQPYKAVFMVMFQGAMGLSEFDVFNRVAWRDVVGHLDEQGPVCVRLYRSKTSRTEVKRYYTFLGEDAKLLIREWLRIRPAEAGEGALFVTFNKNLSRWVPVTGELASNMIRKVAYRAGLITRNSLGRYHIHAHEFRDLFRSLCTLAGVHRVASEFFLGHEIDRLGYDKSPEYDVEWFRREYMKVEPKLNVLSNPSGGAIEQVKREASIEAIKAFARMLGIQDLEIKIARLTEAGLDEVEAVGRVVRMELGLEPMRISPPRSKEEDPKKVIGEEELERYLNEGWDVQTVLPSGRILIRKG